MSETIKRNKQHIVLASNNTGKIDEIKQLVSNFNVTVSPQSQFNVPTIEETGLTFVENAILKVRHAAKQTGLPAIADDSGIVVDALNGLPGVHSARFAKKNASDQDNINKLIKLIEPLTDKERAAHFICIMVYLRHAGDPKPLIAEGIWQGLLRL